MHQIHLIVSKCYHGIWNTVGFLALHFGTQLKHKITNVLVLMGYLFIVKEQTPNTICKLSVCLHIFVKTKASYKGLT